MIGPTATFEAWVALAFPWLAPEGRDYQNLRAAWEAGHEAALVSDARRAKQEGAE